jgi:hypothetical protein
MTTKTPRSQTQTRLRAPGFDRCPNRRCRYVLPTLVQVSSWAITPTTRRAKLRAEFICPQCRERFFIEADVHR